jgi:hypothetical protein
VNELRKLLMILLVVLLLLVFVIGVLPVNAERGNTGEPPGWSHVNPGQGGTDPPGQGDGGGGP